MKKEYFIFILVLLILSCSKNKKKAVSESHNSDSISYYVTLSNRNNISKNERIKCLDKALNLIRSTVNTKKNREFSYEIISKYYSLNQWEKYKLACELFLDNSISSNDSIDIAKSYRSFGNYYFQKQVLDSAFSFYSKSEKKYKELNDLDGYSTILLKKGIIQYNINDFFAADLSLSTALTLAKQNNDKAKIYSILNQLGLVSNQLGEYDKAISYLDEALKIIRENDLQNSEHQESICLSNIGLVYQNLKDYKKAIHYYQLSLNFKGLKADAPILYSNIIDNLSYTKLQINDYEKLPKLFFESLEIRKKIENPSSIIVSYIHISEYYLKTKDTIKAMLFARKSLELAKEKNIAYDILLSLKQMSLVDDLNSKKYSDDYIRISDSLQVVERKSKDRFARLQLETEEIKKENSDLEEKNRNILNYFMGTMVIGGFLFFMRAQRARSRELILRQSQQRANEEIYKLIITQQNKLEEGRVLEKSRIAKELHDGVLGRMFGLRLNLDGLNQRNDEEAIRERVRCLEELKTIEQDLREISHELSREKYVLINNFVAIVNNLLEEQAKVNTATLSTKIDANIDWDLLSNTTKINLYRILQESLQNINKYAKASTIKVEFKKDKKGNLILNIADDGIGFEVDKKSKGIGLKNIVTRTHESEGTIEIKSTLNKGTQIKITVPLEHKTIKV